MRNWAGRLLAELVDLVLPVDCPGCGHRAGSDRLDRGGGACAACLAALAGPPVPARPTPAPAGLPVCRTGGEYAGVRRELVLAYKERGRRGLAGPLAAALADVVRTGWPDGGTLVLVPVPGTAAAIRARHGDHMLVLARRVAGQLRREGVDATVARPLRARRRPDSAHLDRFARAAAARHAFAPRPGWTAGSRGVAGLRSAADTGAVVLLDDVLTTGATLAAMSDQLWRLGVPVAFAATVAAARLRHGVTPTGVPHAADSQPTRSTVGDDAAAWTV